MERRGHAPVFGRLWWVCSPPSQRPARSVIVNALNPKVALFFLAFLPQFVDPSRGVVPVQILALGIIFFIGLCVDLLYAAASGALGGWLGRRPALLRRRRCFTGAVHLLGLGAAAAVGSADRQRG